MLGDAYEQVRVSKLDVGVLKEAQQLIELASGVAPLGGIFHTAAYLADRLIANQACSLLPVHVDWQSS